VKIQNFLSRVKSKIISFFNSQAEKKYVEEMYTERMPIVHIESGEEPHTKKCDGEMFWEFRREQLYIDLRHKNLTEEEIEKIVMKEFPKYESKYPWDIETEKVIKKIHDNFVQGETRRRELNKRVRVFGLERNGFSKKKIQRIIEEEFGGNDTNDAFIRQGA